MSDIRPIDANALKKTFVNACIYGLPINELYVAILKIIDNAPTVAVNCKDCDGYEAGYSAGMRDTERPQGGAE